MSTEADWRLRALDRALHDVVDLLAEQGTREDRSPLLGDIRRLWRRRAYLQYLSKKESHA